MNPSVLNFLQAQQEQAQQEQDPYMGQEMIMPEPKMRFSQEQPQMSQMQAPQMQQAPQEQAPYNPFDSGIQKAISSARESLGMTEQQKDRALRSSILAFGDNIGQQPRQKGFWNNFGSAARALSPAITSYDKSEEDALAQNNTLANQILAYQAAEEKKQSQIEDTNWKRGFDEEQFAAKKQQATDQLAEQTRYHNLMKPKPAANAKGAVNEDGYDSKTLEYIRKKNVDHMEDIYKKNKASDMSTQALSDIKDILVKEKNEGSWQQGSGVSAQIARFSAKAAGQDDAAKMILLKRMPLYASLKEMFGSRITNLDLELFIKSLPGLDQPPEVAIKALDDLIKSQKLDSRKRNLRQNITEEYFNNSVPMYSPKVDREIEKSLALEEKGNLETKPEPTTGINLYDPAINKTYYNVTPEHAQHYLSQNPNLVQQ